MLTFSLLSVGSDSPTTVAYFQSVSTAHLTFESFGAEIKPVLSNMADISENDDDEVPSQKKQKIVYPQKTRDLVDKKAAKAEQEQDSDGELEEIYDQDGTLHYKKRRAEPEEDDFERQLRLEREEAERKAAAKKTKTDADGTEYEWDETVKGWFPKVINQNLEALIVPSDSSF